MVVAGGELENQLKLDGRIHMHWKENSHRIVAEAMTFSGCADQVSSESIVALTLQYCNALPRITAFVSLHLQNRNRLSEFHMYITKV